MALFDSSYEGLLSLGETLGEVRSKATPADVIASLPTGTYHAWAKEDSETRCPICLDDARICQTDSYGRDDPVMKLVECTHWLHKGCLEQWLKTANTCPVCRKKVKDSPKCPYKASIMTSARADSGLDSRSSSTRSSYVRPGGPGTSGPPPWWR
ncbi:hypothetical protein F4604DRAFT_1879900 [Suillus subluteus]|nr:hypothetical protein F4604DRAFT_1879900 [Suillus subluteus]